MFESIPQLGPLHTLQQFGAVLRQMLDQSQAAVLDLNRTIRDLGHSGLIHETFLAGDCFHQEPYESLAECDSGWAYQATLGVPNGFGAARWDSEELFDALRRGREVETEARQRNVLFEALPPRVQARLQPHLHPLIDRLLQEIGAKPHRSATR